MASVEIIRDTLRTILRERGLPESLAGRVRFEGSDPVLRTPYRIGTGGAAALGAVGLALDELRGIKTGKHAELSIDVRAAVGSLRGSRYTVRNGKVGFPAISPIGGFYQVAAGRWCYFHCTMRRHSDAILRVLGATPEREAVRQKAINWQAVELEEAVDAAGGCAPAVRTPAEWNALPNSLTLAGEPLVDIQKIADSPPIVPGGDPLPLTGVRVLDLTRVLAGPTCTRLLAEYGADVLKVTCDLHPDNPALEIETGYGKRHAVLDIKSLPGRKTMQSLVKHCDVFCQSYRPGAMDGLELSVGHVAQTQPGVIYANLNAFGYRGPWRNRRGFDTVVQAASGMAHTMGEIDGEKCQPCLMPVEALDYITGYLLTFGILVALKQRATYGGSYCINVSLARTREWLTSLGLLETELFRSLANEFHEEELARWKVSIDTPYGLLDRLRPVIRFSDGAFENLPTWNTASLNLAEWL